MPITPTVDSVEVYAFGRELDADGFTAYVGDKPFTLSAYPHNPIFVMMPSTVTPGCVR